MAINRNITRLTNEDELNGALSVFDPNWMSLSPEVKQSQATSILSQYGGDKNRLLGDFNLQFGTNAGMSDLDYLLNYKPEGQRAVVSGPSQAETDLRSLYRDVLGRDPDEEGLQYWLGQVGPTLESNEREWWMGGAQEELARKGDSKTTSTDAGALSQVDSSVVQDAGEVDVSGSQGSDTTDIADALNMSVEDVNALINDSNVLDTIGASFDQDALNRLTASVDPEAIAADLNPKIEAAQQDTVIDFQGNEYSGSEILNLAKQISGSLDVSKIGGAVYGTQGSSIGFDFEMAKKILGRDPTAADQVLLDMARNLRLKGITDLSQIKVEDVTSTIETSVYTDPETGEKFLVDTDGNKIRSLTPEEISNLRAKEVDAGDGTYTQEVLDQEVTTKQTVGPDGKPIYLYGEDGGNVFGETYTGEGATDYVMEIDPETGLPKFYTTGRVTSDMEQIQLAMTFLSFIPTIAPFIHLVQGAYAASQGNPLAAAAAFAGAGGYTDAARILAAANAAKNGDLVSAAFSLAGTSYGQDVLKTDLGGGFTVNDVVTAGKIVSGIDQGNYGMALSAAGDLMKSSDLKAAAAGLNVYNAITSGNPVSILNALDDAKKVVEYIGGNTAAKDSITTTAPSGSGLTVPGSTSKGPSLTESGKASLTGEGSLSDQAWEAGLTSFMNASNSGLSFDDALARSNREVGNLLATESGGALATPFTGISDLNTQKDWDKAVSAYTYAINKGSTAEDAFRFSKLVAGGQEVIPTETKLDASNVTLTKNESDELGKQIGGGTQVSSIKMSYGDQGDKDMGTIYVFGPKAQQSFSDVMNLPGARPLDLISRKDGEMWEVDDQTFYKAGDKIFSMPTVVAQTIGIPVAALGEMMSAAGGAAAAVGAANQDNWLTKTGNLLNSKGVEALGDDVNRERSNIINAVKDAEGPWGKFKAVLSSSYDNPLGAASYVAVELPQEFAVIGAATKIAKTFGLLAGIGADMAMNALESGGAGYNEAYTAAIKAGKSEEEARQIGLDRALTDAATAATIGSVVDASIIKGVTKSADDAVTAGTRTITDTAIDLGKGTGKSISTTVKEFGTEGTEAAIGTAVTGLGIDGKVNWNDIWNSFTIEGAIGGKTGGTIQSTVTAIGPDSSTAEVVYSLAPGQGDAVMSTVSGITSQGGSPADVAANLQTSLSNLGLDASQIQSITNTTIAESAVNQINSGGVFTIGDVGTIVGTDANGANITLGDVIADSALNRGGSFNVDSNVVIGVNADGSSMTLGDLADVSKGGTVVSSSTDGSVTTENTVNPITGSETTSTTDTSTGITTSVTNNSNTGVTTESVVNSNTGVKTESTVDQNTGVTTESTIDSNGTTQITNDGNVSTESTVDVNSGVASSVTTNLTTNSTTETKVDTGNNSQTTVTVDGNTTTETNIDANNGVATNVTTNPDTKITTTIDTNNNTFITVTTDLDTGEVSEEKKPLNEVPIEQIIKTVSKTPTKSTSTPVGALPFALQAAIDLNPKVKSDFDNLLTKGFKGFKSPLDDFLTQVDEDYAQKIAEQEAAEDAKRKQEEEMKRYFNYGREQEIDDILKGSEGEVLSESFDFLNQFPERAAKSGGLMTPLMAKGGNPPAVHYAGKPRMDFRKGAHVAGPGDGQSDDIPAMLADGEFVFPADVVAALGNGSTKAGSDKLYEMMHEIRRRYRSAKPKDLPPPAKSPLEYLSKKGRR